jgi:SAM-dependent methyltransferase
MAVLRPLCREQMRKWLPGDFSEIQAAWHAERFAFHAALVATRAGSNATVCDVGGGWGHFAAVCAQIGMTAISVDQDPPADDNDPRVGMSREYGFELRIRDVVKSELGFAPESVDAFTSFDCIEHLHHSPKRHYHELIAALKPGGIFLLGAPNSVNLRKRIAYVFGRAKWTDMQCWYEEQRFLGHVREPDVADLRYIAKDLGLEAVEVFGRNWLGHCSPRPLIRLMTRLTDLPLCAFPSLCSDIYMIGRKPRQA